MSINLNNGKWQCFKSGERGSFIYLYSLLEDIPYYQAKNKFTIEAFFSEEEESKEPEKPKQISIAEYFKDFLPVKEIEFDFNFTGVDLTKLQPQTDNPYVVLAKEYLRNRKLHFVNGFYVAVSGPYVGRLILPFLNNFNGQPFFFQARILPQLEKAGYHQKYLNPKNLKFSDILYPYDMESTKPLIVCEGVLDAISVKTGIVGETTSTGSCNVSIAQMEQLKLYRGEVIFAYDNDDAGRKGLLRAEKIRRKVKAPHFKYAFPPKGRKDWNEVLCKDGPNAIFKEIAEAQEFDPLEWLINSELDTWDQ